MNSLTPCSNTGHTAAATPLFQSTPSLPDPVSSILRPLTSTRTAFLSPNTSRGGLSRGRPSLPPVCCVSLHSRLLSYSINQSVFTIILIKMRLQSLIYWLLAVSVALARAAQGGATSPDLLGFYAPASTQRLIFVLYVQEMEIH
jgi:hypothetical protein